MIQDFLSCAICKRPLGDDDFPPLRDYLRTSSLSLAHDECLEELRSSPKEIFIPPGYYEDIQIIANAFSTKEKAIDFVKATLKQKMQNELSIGQEPADVITKRYSAKLDPLILKIVRVKVDHVVDERDLY